MRAAGAVALVVSGYVAASRQDVEGTTEAAALGVIGAGRAAGIGWLELASGTIAVSVLLLLVVVLGAPTFRRTTALLLAAIAAAVAVTIAVLR